MFGVRRSEWPLALPLGLVFFLIITSFWVLKSLKKGLFVGFYQAAPDGFFGLGGAQAEQLAKVLNLFVAAVAVLVFSRLADRFVRERLVAVLSGFFIVTLIGYAAALPRGADIASAPDGLVWSFYLYGDLYSTVMVAGFFAFLNDSVTPEAAKRLYGLIGFGGVLGGAVGSTAVRGFVHVLEPGAWMAVLAGVTAGVAGLAAVAGRRAQPTEGRAEAQPARPGAWEGMRLVARSRYLWSVAALVGLYEVISTLLDFQFTSTVEYHLKGEALRAHFATVFAITNGVAMVVQLGFTSLIMRRLGVGAALLVLPIAAIGGSAAFLAAPVLWAGSLLNTVDNAFAYSVHQSAKETLYVPTSRAEKYKAKAFIDMFVQRFAKVLGVVLGLGLTVAVSDFSGVRFLSLLTLPLLVGFVAVAIYAGRRFDRFASSADTPTK